MEIDANLVIAQIPHMTTKQEQLLSDETRNAMRPHNIGDRLRLVREALGMKPSEIADTLGIERTYWSRFEKGSRAVNETTAALLNERYGVTLDFLVLGKWDKLPLDLAERMRAISAK